MNVADERKGRWRRGGGHSCSHTVHGITHTPTHTSVQPGCSTCSGLNARHASTPRVAHTVAHTSVSSSSSRVDVCPAVCPCRCCCCCCDVYCHREGREEERQLGHDAMTRVVVVAAGCEHHVAWWHQQTTQHSKGKGRGGAATRTVTHPPPPQPSAQTSIHQPAVVGKRPVVWLCETSLSPSPPTHTHTPNDEAMEK